MAAKAAQELVAFEARVVDEASVDGRAKPPQRVVRTLHEGVPVRHRARAEFVAFHRLLYLGRDLDQGLVDVAFPRMLEEERPLVVGVRDSATVPTMAETAILLAAEHAVLARQPDADRQVARLDSLLSERMEPASARHHPAC